MNILKHTIKNQNAITLIALIITIIVLLILATISIYSIFGDNNVLDKASSAKEETQKSQAFDELSLKTSIATLEKRGTATLQDVVDYFNTDTQNSYVISLEEIQNDTNSITDVSSADIIYVLYKGYQFKINSNLEVSFLNGSYTSNPTQNSGSESAGILASNINKAIEYGKDVQLSSIYRNSSNPKFLYNGTEISSTKDLPIGNWLLTYNKNTNTIVIGNYIQDLSGLNHNLYLKNGTSLIKNSSNNNCLYFNGIDNYAQINEFESSIDWQSGFTIEFEAEWNAFNSWSRILDFGNGTANNNFMLSNNSTSSTLCFSSYNGTTGLDTNLTTITENSVNKYKIDIVKGENFYTITTLVNGDQSTETNSYMSITNVQRLYNYIGKSNWYGDGYFKGSIYSLKLTLANGTEILNYDLNAVANLNIIGSNFTENIADLSGNNHILDLKQGASVQKDANNKYYLNFNGTNNYAQLNDLPNSIDWNNGYTVEFEAEWNAFNYWSRIFDFSNGNLDNSIILANSLNTSNLSSVIYLNSSECRNDLTQISQNAKVKYKIQHEKENSSYKISLYVNDEKINDYPLVGLPTNLTRTVNYIAKSNYASDGYFKGKIYSLKITQSDGTLILWYDINKWLEN